MSNTFDDLKNKWQDAKKEHPKQSINTEELISLSQKKMRQILNMHLRNIAVLVLTLIGISAFFVYVANFQQTLSHIGMALMLGGLVIRIAIEVYSIFRSRKIDISQSATSVNEQYLDFHNYRKRIHGTTTLVILLAYSIGFYLLMPEFSLYFSQTMIILLCLSYLVAAAIFGYSIKTAIRKEMNYLKELLEVREEIGKD